MSSALVVVDSDRSMDILVRALRALRPGAAIERVAAGNEVLERVAMARPDLVVIGEPLVGIGFAKFAALLKEARPEVRLLVLLPVEERSETAGRFEDGADDVLLEPLEPKECLARLRFLFADLGAARASSHPAPLDLSSVRGELGLYAQDGRLLAASPAFVPLASELVAPAVERMRAALPVVDPGLGGVSAAFFPANAQGGAFWMYRAPEPVTVAGDVEAMLQLRVERARVTGETVLVCLLAIETPARLETSLEERLVQALRRRLTLAAPPSLLVWDVGVGVVGFCVVPDASDLVGWCDALVRRLGRPLDGFGPEASTAVLRFGFARAPTDGTSLAAALRVADRSLATARRHAASMGFADGRLQAQALRREKARRELEWALKDQHVAVRWQQRFRGDRPTETLVAKLLWMHPRKGPIADGAVRDFARKAGTLAELEGWLFRRVMREAYGGGFPPQTRFVVPIDTDHWPAVVDPATLPSRSRVHPALRQPFGARDEHVTDLARLRERDVVVEVTEVNLGGGPGAVRVKAQLPGSPVWLDPVRLRRQAEFDVLALLIDVARELGIEVVGCADDDSSLAVLRRCGAELLQGEAVRPVVEGVPEEASEEASEKAAEEAAEGAAGLG